MYDAAERYQQEEHPLIILAGKEYGSGSSRDWAAKGPYLQVSCWHWTENVQSLIAKRNTNCDITQ